MSNRQLSYDSKIHNPNKFSPIYQYKPSIIEFDTKIITHYYLTNIFMIYCNGETNVSSIHYIKYKLNTNQRIPIKGNNKISVKKITGNNNEFHVLTKEGELYSYKINSSITIKNIKKVICHSNNNSSSNINVLSLNQYFMNNTVIDIANNDKMTICVDSQNTLYYWGCINNNNSYKTFPKFINIESFKSPITQVSLGDEYLSFLLFDGTVYFSKINFINTEEKISLSGNINIKYTCNLNICINKLNFKSKIYHVIHSKNLIILSLWENNLLLIYNDNIGLIELNLGIYHMKSCNISKCIKTINNIIFIETVTNGSDNKYIIEIDYLTNSKIRIYEIINGENCSLITTGYYEENILLVNNYQISNNNNNNSNEDDNTINNLDKKKKIWKLIIEDNVSKISKKITPLLFEPNDFTDIKNNYLKTNNLNELNINTFNNNNIVYNNNENNDIDLEHKNLDAHTELMNLQKYLTKSWNSNNNTPNISHSIKSIKCKNLILKNNTERELKNKNFNKYLNNSIKNNNLNIVLRETPKNTLNINLLLMKETPKSNLNSVLKETPKNINLIRNRNIEESPIKIIDSKNNSNSNRIKFKLERNNSSSQYVGRNNSQEDNNNYFFNNYLRATSSYSLFESFKKNVSEMPKYNSSSINISNMNTFNNKYSEPLASSRSNNSYITNSNNINNLNKISFSHSISTFRNYSSLNDPKYINLSTTDKSIKTSVSQNKTNNSDKFYSSYKYKLNKNHSNHSSFSNPTVHNSIDKNKSCINNNTSVNFSNNYMHQSSIISFLSDKSKKKINRSLID